MTILSPEHLQARASFASEEAARWKRHHAEEFEKLSAGTHVIIDLASGEFVTGEDWKAAEAAFHQRFGSGEHLSHSFTVGRPIFVSGGLWQK